MKKYSVNTTHRTLLETPFLSVAKSFAFQASRDNAPMNGHSPNKSDLKGPVVVYDNINGKEVFVYNFTKKQSNQYQITLIKNTGCSILHCRIKQPLK